MQFLEVANYPRKDNNLEKFHFFILFIVLFLALSRMSIFTRTFERVLYGIVNIAKAMVNCCTSGECKEVMSAKPRIAEKSRPRPVPKRIPRSARIVATRAAIFL